MNVYKKVKRDSAYEITLKLKSTNRLCQKIVNYGQMNMLNLIKFLITIAKQK